MSRQKKMEFHLLVSPDFHEKLKCSLCKNYLSYFPIYICSNDESVCGRCTVPEGRISYHDEAFQTIAQLIKFHCRYQSEGCSEEFSPKDMPQHEENCSYRLVPCFIKKPSPCKWKGSLSTLLAHYWVEHSDMILRNGKFQIDLSVSEECDSLLENNNVLFLFTRKFDSESKMFNCAIYNNEYEVNTANYSAQLSFRNANRTLLLDFNTTTSEETVFTNLSLQSLGHGSENQELIEGAIDIGKGTSNGECNAKINSEIMSLLKCCMCSDHCESVVYCGGKNEETICTSCYPKHKDSCTICPQTFSNRRISRTLSSCVELLTLSCKFQNNGCTFASKVGQVRNHQSFCEYEIGKCPLHDFDACNWEGLKRDLTDHILNNHDDLLLNPSKVELELSEKDTTMTHFIQVFNKLFRLTYCVRNDKKFVWFVEKIEPCKELFKYRLDFVDINNSGRKLSTTQPVLPKVCYCCYDKKKLKDFLYVKIGKGSTVKFRVHIIK